MNWQLYVHTLAMYQEEIGALIKHTRVLS